MTFEGLVPICGYASITVEANSKKEAIDEAFKEGCSREDIVEFDMYEHIVEGNVFNGGFNSIEVISIND